MTTSVLQDRVMTLVSASVILSHLIYYPLPGDNASLGLNHTHLQLPGRCWAERGKREGKVSAGGVKGNSICWLQPAAQTVYALGLPDLRQPLSLQLSTQASLGKGKYRKEQLTALNFKIYHSSNHSPDYIQHYRKTRYEFQMVFWFSQKPKFGSNKIIKINKARKSLPCINGFLEHKILHYYLT